MVRERTAASQGPWICSKRWDLGWLILSVLVVPIAPLMYHFGLTANEVAMVILVLVGGPHVFVTFTRTNMDPKFVRGHRAYTRLAYTIPILVALFAYHYKTLFLTVFFTWASLHVLQQIAYIANRYSERQKFANTTVETAIEYGLIFSCLYPFATYRMWTGTFQLDGTDLLVPTALLGPGLLAAAFAVFGVFLAGWTVLVLRRARAGTLHYGKTALIGATVGATFFTPLFPNLDVAFQGVNAWHCVQYLALIWWANRIRDQRGEVEWGFVRSLSAKGWGGLSRYYGTAVLVTVGLYGIVLLVHKTLGVSELLAYYMVGKGLLLTHYYYDTFLFTQRDELAAPLPAPMAA